MTGGTNAMRLAVNLSASDTAELAVLAERLGYSTIFVPEGYATEAVSVLGLLAGLTERIGLASGVMEIPVRTPVMTAMTAATLDLVSRGRFRLGLGVANAHVATGWHGMSFARPAARTREYVEIVRRILRREEVVYAGEHYRVTEPFRLVLPPAAPYVPVYLAAVGPRSLRLAGEIADGWFGVFHSPRTVAQALAHIRAGRGTAELNGFDVALSVPVVVGDDLSAAAEPVRRYLARFVGLGDPAANVYYALLCRLGYAHAAGLIHERQQAGDAVGAVRAVPASLVDRIALVGPLNRIAAGMRAYAQAGVTTLAVSPLAASLDERCHALDAATRALAMTQPHALAG
jgi:F420-dependent oxidoreductase-like protein